NGHAERDVAGRRLDPREQRVECELDVLEALDRQVEPCREASDDIRRDAAEVGVAWDRERDLVSHALSSAPPRGRARGAPPPPSPRSRSCASHAWRAATTRRETSRRRGP